jgi:hypothetical protein
MIATLAFLPVLLLVLHTLDPAPFKLAQPPVTPVAITVRSEEIS